MITGETDERKWPLPLSLIAKNEIAAGQKRGRPAGFNKLRFGGPKRPGVFRAKPLVFQGFMPPLCTDIAFIESTINMSASLKLKVRCALVIATAVGANLPQLVQPYALEGPQWPNGANPVIQLELGPASGPLQDGSTSWNTAVSPSLDAWNQVLGSVQFGRVMDSTAPVSSGDGVNSISFAGSVFGQSFGSNTLAVTYYRFAGSTMQEGDILLNVAQPFDSYRGALQSGAYDIRRVALHELGHVLGLGHPDQAGQQLSAIMNSVISDLESLTSDDIAGVDSLYGAGTTPTPSPTPSATPTPSPSPDPSATPIPTPTPGPSATPISTPRSSPSPSVTPIPTPTPSPSPSVTPIPTPTPSPSPSPSVTPIPTPTPSPSPSVTPIPTPTPNPTPGPSATPPPSQTPAVSISVSPSTVQSGGTAIFTISVSTPDSSNSIVVNYSMSGTAVRTKTKKSAPLTTITIPPGTNSASITVTASIKGKTAKTETVSLMSGSGYVVSAPSSATASFTK